MSATKDSFEKRIIKALGGEDKDLCGAEDIIAEILRPLYMELAQERRWKEEYEREVHRLRKVAVFLQETGNA